MARSALLNIMVQAATKAGRSLTRDFGEVENLQVSVKGPADFVSNADKQAEKIVFEELQKLFVHGAALLRANLIKLILAIAKICREV